MSDTHVIDAPTKPVNNTGNEPRAPRATETRLQLSEHARVHWDYTPEAGTAFETLLDPAYWAHVTKRLNFNNKGLGAMIDVIAEDYSYIGKLLVVDVGRVTADVIQIDFKKLERKIRSVEAKEFSVTFGGNVHKWRVTRLSDKRVLQSGMQDEAAANLWLSNYLKAH